MREVDDEELYRLIDEQIEAAEEKNYMPVSRKIQIRTRLFDSFRRLDILQELIDRNDITEIMVNGHEHVFVEQLGQTIEWPLKFKSREQLEDLIQQIVSRVNRVVNVSQPIVDARLPDGSRVHVVLPPVSLSGPILTIRKFPDPISMEKLISFGAITREAAEFMGRLVRAGYNIFISGGTNSGKTTFLEAGLLNTKVISRLGKVEDGNTVSDYEKMEIEKGFTISQTIVPVEFNGVKLNFVDTPGFFDYSGEARAALSTGATAIIMVDASAGIQVGTEKAFELVKEFNSPTFFVINKTDKGSVDDTVAAIQDAFGTACVTLDDREALEEAIAGADEELMEKYFEALELTEAEIIEGLKAGVADRSVVPVFASDAMTNGMFSVLFFG